MSVDLFRRYAEEALRQAAQSKNEKEQLALIELVRTWTEAAESTSESAMVFIERMRPEQKGGDKAFSSS